MEALMKLYPELSLKKGSFLESKKGRKQSRWKAVGKRRNFFEEFSKSKNFDPLDAQKWYSITHGDIMRAGGSGLLYYYNRSHIEALVKLYPELMLKRENFLKFKEVESKESL